MLASRSTQHPKGQDPVTPSAAEPDRQRLVAWHRELLAAHDRLRRLLQEAQDAASAGELPAAGTARTELLAHCHGFCTALTTHHEGEDRALFPDLAQRYPDLRPTIAKLHQDHEMIATLLAGFADAVTTATDTRVLASHLDGLAAIMESHFRYEDRELLTILQTLTLEADPREVFG